MNENTWREEKKLFHCLPAPIEVLDRKKAIPRSTTQLHIHDYLELIYCVEGQIRVITINDSIVLNPDEMIVINSNEPHEIDRVTDINRHYCIKFMQQLLTPFNDHSLIHFYKTSNFLSQINSFVYFSKDKVINSPYSLKKLFADAYNCYRNNEIGNTFSLYADILNIVAFIFRNITLEANTVDYNLIDNNHLIIKKIDAYINENYQTATLAGLAKECSVSYAYLSTVFKELYGESFRNYLIKFRINQSIPMLCETKMDITTIAQTVGFSTSSHYIKMFKKEKNVSPGKFRQITQSKNITK